jgi:hypothetical protein
MKTSPDNSDNSFPSPPGDFEFDTGAPPDSGFPDPTVTPRVAMDLGAVSRASASLGSGGSQGTNSIFASPFSDSLSGTTGGTGRM